MNFDVFNQDAFTAVTMSRAVDKIDFVPRLLGSIPGLWEMEPIRTEAVWIEDRATGVSVLQTSPRGSAPSQVGGDKRKVRDFRTVRLAQASRITAAELQNIRAYGSESELKQLAVEVTRRQLKIMQNFDLTFENLRLSTIMGVTRDADGTPLYDWAGEWGQTQLAEVAFDLNNASPAAGALLKACNKITRGIQVGLKGVGVADRIIGLADDTFWDALTTNAQVERTFANWQGSEALRGTLSKPWSAPFHFGGIDWINYRGTDDGSTVKIPNGKVRFFPVGAGIFKWVMSPGERFEHVNTPGQNFYSSVALDKDDNSWADVKVFSYPLPVCTMPQALASGRVGA